MNNRHQEEISGATDASVDALAGQPEMAASGIPELIRTLTQLVGEFSGLVALESKVAVSSIPDYFDFTFLKLFMLMCVWLSLSGCVMWLVVLAADSVLIGLITMTGLQLLGYLICRKMQAIYRHRLTLPNTRQQLIQLGESIRESIQTATRTG